MYVEIHVTAGPAKGQSFIFKKPGKLLFGRDTDAHISVPDDQYVSRQHFVLEIDPPVCKLRDLNSTNGVFVNGVHYGGKISPQADTTQALPGVKEVFLKDGDEIAVRDTRIKISIQPISKEDPSAEILVPSKTSLTANQEVALLALNIGKLAQDILDNGRTQTSPLIGSILTKIKSHFSSSELLFLKYMGDGFLMAFPTVCDALSLALALLDLPEYLNVHIHMALHWGTVKSGPKGDILGREVHRVYRIENIQMSDQIEPVASSEVLSDDNRILITQEGLEQLSDPDRLKFRPAGTFQLKGFDEFCQLWVLQKEVS